MVDILTTEPERRPPVFARRAIRVVRMVLVTVLSVIGFVVNTPSYGGTVGTRQSVLDAFFVAIFIAAALAVVGEIVGARREPPNQLGVVLVALVFGIGMLCLAGVFYGIAAFDLFRESFSSRSADIALILAQFLLFVTWEGEVVNLFLRLKLAGVSLERRASAGKGWTNR